LIKHVYAQETAPELFLMTSCQIVSSDFKYQIINYDLESHVVLINEFTNNEEQNSPYQATIPLGGLKRPNRAPNGSTFDQICTNSHNAYI
jgi:hypothetical protein